MIRSLERRKEGKGTKRGEMSGETGGLMNIWDDVQSTGWEMNTDMGRGVDGWLR